MENMKHTKARNKAKRRDKIRNEQRPGMRQKGEIKCEIIKGQE